MSKIKLSVFLKNIITTTMTSLIVIVSMIFIIRFLARGLGEEEFGAYSLARRIISNIVPFVVLSIDIGLARYIAMTNENKSQAAYIFSAIIIAGSAFILVLIVTISASHHLTYLIFKSDKYIKLFQSSLFLLGGYSILVVTYSIFRGLQKFNIANSLQLCLMAIIPLMISYSFAFKKDSSLIVFLIGLGYYLSIFPLILLVAKKKLPRINDIKTSMKNLLKYGLPRVPGGFAFAGLLTLGPFLAGQTGDLKNAGYFVVGQSVFRVMESAIIGFGLVALPKISQLIAENKMSFLKSKIEDILIMIFQIGLFITIHIFIWSKEIILVWLGSDYIEAVPILKIIILSLGPYLGYAILRSIINAIEVRAINTINLFFSLVSAIIVSIISIYTGFGMIGLAVATTIGFAILGIMTSGYLIKRFQISFKNFLFQWVILLNVFFAFSVIIVKHYISPYISIINLLIIGFIIEGFFLGSYLYFFYRKNCQWIFELKKRIFS